MNRVKFVPADVAARTLAPSSVLVIECAKATNWPHPPPNGWKRRPTRDEACKVAARRGWVMLSLLPAGEKKFWLARYRCTRVRAFIGQEALKNIDVKELEIILAKI